MGSELNEASGSPEPEVELPAELRAEIRRLAQRLPGMNYYAVLEVDPDADDAAIRQAFFQRSKRFHPDRYFRKHLGAYEGLLHEIYKRVVVAHEVLRDERLRSDYDRRIRATPAASPEKSPEAERPGGAPSLRSRRGLRSPHVLLRRLEGQIQQGKEKAARHFAESEHERERGNWVRAASLVRLAMVFDPREASYHESLADLLPRANAERVSDLRREARKLLTRGEKDAALMRLDEATNLLPTDGEFAIEVANLANEVGRADLAIELAERAISLQDRNRQFHKTLARLYKSAGESEKARREFQRVWQLDPLDEEAKQELGVKT